jgi:single-stranded-DNA-specific exonuclease
MQTEKSIKGYYWKLKDYDKNKAYELYQKLSISEPLSRLLAIKNITLEDSENYINPRIKTSLPDPFHLLDMDLAVSRIISAINNNEKITIFGDYDVDGATSSALLKIFLRKIGIDSTVFIPDRTKDGYGPNTETFTKIANDGTNLIVCTDCGTVAYEPIKLAKSLNIDTIVIDHHLGAETNPEAIAIINPNRIDETTEHKNLAAVGVAFLLCVALNKTLREQNFYSKNNINEPDLMSFLDIVALGTVCDVMPLTGLNRAFVSQGTKIMQNNHNIGLKCMLEAIGIEEIVNTYHMGFLIGPRINAGGRIGDSKLGTALLSTEDESQAREITYKLDLYNTERQTLEKQVLEEAINQIEKNKLYNNAVICVQGEKWHEGVIGIIASRIKDRYNKPAVAISIDNDNAKASCRSIHNVDLGSAIIKAKECGLLTEGGGHMMAGGFSTTTDKLEQTKQFFNDHLSKAILKELENKELQIDLSINPSGVNAELATEIEKLGPYGTGNHKPLVLLKEALVLKVETIGKNAEHIRCIIASDNLATLGKGTTSVAFNTFNTPMHKFLLSSKGKKIDLAGTISINRWNGKETAQFIIEDAMESEKISF